MNEFKSPPIPSSAVPKPPSKLTDIKLGLELCTILYNALRDRGYFPALSGGLVYKSGPRKDVDIVIYRHRQMHNSFEMHDIEDELVSCGLTNIEYYGFVTKAKFRGYDVDLFNPESSGEYKR